jgi:hypothetical protein
MVGDIQFIPKREAEASGFNDFLEGMQVRADMDKTRRRVDELPIFRGLMIEKVFNFAAVDWTQGILISRCLAC